VLEEKLLQNLPLKTERLLAVSFQMEAETNSLYVDKHNEVQVDEIKEPHVLAKQPKQSLSCEREPKEDLEYRS